MMCDGWVAVCQRFVKRMIKVKEGKGSV